MIIRKKRKESSSEVVDFIPFFSAYYLYEFSLASELLFEQQKQKQKQTPRHQ